MQVQILRSYEFDDWGLTLYRTVANPEGVATCFEVC